LGLYPTCQGKGSSTQECMGWLGCEPAQHWHDGDALSVYRSAEKRAEASRTPDRELVRCLSAALRAFQPSSCRAHARLPPPPRGRRYPRIPSSLHCSLSARSLFLTTFRLAHLPLTFLAPRPPFPLPLPLPLPPPPPPPPSLPLPLPLPPPLLLPLLLLLGGIVCHLSTNASNCRLCTQGSRGRGKGRPRERLRRG